MPAPGQHIHFQPGRICELHQDDAVAGNGIERFEVGLTGVDVEAIEHQSDGLMVGTAHDFPGIAIVVDVTPPSQRFETDTKAAFGRSFTELTEVGRCAVNATKRIRRHIAADHQQVAAKLLHHIEFALGAVERALALAIRHALEITERLERDRLEPKIGHLLGDVGGRAAGRKQVAFENFDTAESRRGDRFKLLAQAAAKTNGGNRGLHDRASSLSGISRIAGDPRRIES